MINYNNKSYAISGFLVVSDQPIFEIQLTVSMDSSANLPKTLLDENEMEKTPKIKAAIEQIGTYQISSSESVGMTEYEWNQYRIWYDRQSEKQSSTNGYFKYKEEVFALGFAIC